MDDQIDLFKDYIARLQTIADGDRINDIISGSLFIACAGNDDIANTYYSTPIRILEYDVPSYVDFMITNAAQFIEVRYVMRTDTVLISTLYFVDQSTQTVRVCFCM